MEDAYYKAMALADGELGSADLPALAHQLVRNSALMRAAQTFIDLRRGSLARTYAKRLEEPVPQHIMDLLETGTVGARRSAPGVGTFIEAVRRKYRMPGWSLAAGPAFAALLAISASWLLAPAAGSEPGLSPQVQAALERSVSSGDSTLPGLTFLQTYWSNDQSWCRQFNVVSGAQQTSAVACRWAEGKWRIVLQTPPVPAGSAAMVPAGTPRAHLDRYVHSHVSGVPLEPDQVKNAIDSGWAPPPAGK
jgi:hypothetical protein